MHIIVDGVQLDAVINAVLVTYILRVRLLHEVEIVEMVGIRVLLMEMLTLVSVLLGNH